MEVARRVHRQPLGQAEGGVVAGPGTGAPNPLRPAVPATTESVPECVTFATALS